jgi:hypothetical protein
MESKLVPKWGKRIQGCGHFEDHISSLTAVPAIRASTGDKLLAAKMDNAISTLARTNLYDSLIYKHRLPSSSDYNIPACRLELGESAGIPGLPPIPSLV